MRGACAWLSLALAFPLPSMPYLGQVPGWPKASIVMLDAQAVESSKVGAIKEESVGLCAHGSGQQREEQRGPHL